MISWSHIVNVLVLGVVALGLGVSSPVQAASGVRLEEGFSLPTLLEVPRVVSEPGDVEPLLDARWYGSFELKEYGETISSCTDYFDARDRYADLQAAEGGAPFMELVAMCVAAKEIIAAEPAQTSFIGAEPIEEQLPSRLPAEIAFITSAAEREHLLSGSKNGRWADVTLIHSAEVLGSGRARFLHDGGVQEIAVVARGDFDRSGLESLLISSLNTVESGSYAAFKLFQVTRTAHNAPYILRKEYIY